MGAALFVLQIVLITLKAADVIDWSWWWVLAPLWGGWVFVLAIASLLGVGSILATRRGSQDSETMLSTAQQPRTRVHGSGTMESGAKWVGVVVVAIAGVLLVRALATNRSKQERVSRDQVFADGVIDAFRRQGDEYERRVRPLHARPRTPENAQEVLSRWSASVEGMIRRLQACDPHGVDPVLVDTYRQAVTTAGQVLRKLRQSGTPIDMELLALTERLGSQQFEFEFEARQRGLRIIATGAD